MHLHWNVMGEGYSQLVWKHHEPLYLFHDQSPEDVTIDSVKHLKSIGILGPPYETTNSRQVGYISHPSYSKVKGWTVQKKHLQAIN